MRSCNQSLTILMPMIRHAFTAQKITFTKAKRRLAIAPIKCFFLTGELRQIKGITENIYQRLIPYVCVLPTSELSINLNMLTENDIPLFRALFLNNITDADARVLLQKRPREGWLTTDAFLYWAQQDFSGVKPLVAQVKGHLFPYSRYFTLSTESISDEQSQGWQSHIFLQP